MQVETKDKIVQVTYPRAARPGQRVKVSAILPARARDIDVDAFTNFQTSHQGKVDVVSLADGIHLARVVQVESTGIEDAAQQFADSITKHLGYVAEPVPIKS